MSDVLGTFEQAVLAAVVRLGTEAYGRGILHDIQERLERDVAAGAVYATLDRLETKGLVTSKVGAGTPERGGRSRRYYAVTGTGIRALNDARSALENVWRGLAWPIKGRA